MSCSCLWIFSSWQKREGCRGLCQVTEVKRAATPAFADEHRRELNSGRNFGECYPTHFDRHRGERNEWGTEI